MINVQIGPKVINKLKVGNLDKDIIDRKRKQALKSKNKTQDRLEKNTKLKCYSI